MATIVNVTTDTSTLACVMFASSSLDMFNDGVYPGTSIRLRRLTGTERVTILGTTAGARVISDESWVADRFGSLGARQVKRLLQILNGSLFS